MRVNITDQRYQITRNFARNPRAASSDTSDWLPRFNWTRQLIKQAIAPDRITTVAHFACSLSSTLNQSAGFDAKYNFDWAAPSKLATTDKGLDFPVTANQPYYIGCWLQCSRNTPSMSCRCGIHDNTGSLLVAGKTIATNKNITANTWVWVGGIVTPALTGWCVCRFNIAPPTGDWLVGDSYDATGLMLMKGPGLYTYADGDSSDWRWEGAPSASTSIGWPTPLQ